MTSRARLVCLIVATAATAARSADPPATPENALRVATYNVAMYRDAAGRLAEELASGQSRQAARLAEVIQRVRPDVLLLNEIDYDPQGDPPGLFAERYLAKPQAEGLAAIDYPHRFTAPVNTGEPSGLDLDRDGRTDGPNDAWGYGRYPGQYGMAVLSRWPIDHAASRTFQNLRWSELPDARAPKHPDTGRPYYDADLWRRLRLPSKSFWDVVVRLPDGGPLHLVCSHPTPPVFDGPEDRNGRRNADEVRLVTEYVSGGLAEYFVDDRGRAGALPAGEPFVVLGDLNADPSDGDDTAAINRLLTSDAVAQYEAPTSRGGPAAVADNPGLNEDHRGDPASDTADFGGDGHGNLRVDYVLPSRGVRVVASGVYWPLPGEPGAEAVRGSDHRLVWADLVLPQTE